MIMHNRVVFKTYLSIPKKGKSEAHMIHLRKKKNDVICGKIFSKHQTSPVHQGTSIQG